MRKLLLAALLVAGAQEARAELASADFLNLPTDVRTLAMAEAGQATARGAGAAQVNPAALSRIESHELYFTHAFLSAGVGMDYLAYGGSIGHHHFGLSLQHVGYGELEGRDNAGNPSANFGPHDDAYNFSYGTDIGPVETAATLRYVNSKIVESASAVTFDLGAQAAVGSDWVLGVTGRNIGGRLRYETESFALPTAVAAGAGWRAVEDWWLALDVVNPIYSPAYVAIGTEYAMPLEDLGALAFRLGMNTKTTDLGAFSGLKAGFGLRIKVLDVDYAFSPAGGLGNTHHLSIGWRFGHPSSHDARPEARRLARD